VYFYAATTDGRATARNKGIANASGMLVSLFLDADDLWVEKKEARASKLQAADKLCG
jgi:glycosyltransferase involved in cell wall biosynthesis